MEEAIQAAILVCNLIEPPFKPNYAQIARNHSTDQFTIHRTTLSRRHRMKTTSREEFISEVCRALTTAQEGELVRCIKYYSARNIHPTTKMVQNFAEEICGYELSKNWVGRFLDRHLDLRTSYLRNIENARSKAKFVPSFILFYELLVHALETYNITMENIYNWDEKGFMMGISHSTKRVMSKEAYTSGRNRQASQDGSREFITLLACVCANGTALPPALIYTGTGHDLLDTWMNDLQEEDVAHFGTSESGWSSHEFGMTWLKDVFNRYTKEKAGRSRRLLIVDGHSSHVNMSFLNWAHSERIIILVLPPHSTHRLQPLDVVMFLPLSQFYSQELQTLMAEGLGFVTPTKRMFFTLFKRAWSKAFTEKNINSAFLKTGIWPLNTSLVIDVISQRPLSPRQYKEGELKTPKSAKAIRKFQREFKFEPTNAKRDKLFKANEELLAQISILTSKARGLENALKQKGEKKRGKPLNLIGEESMGSAQLFSPSRIRKAQEFQALQESEKEKEKSAIAMRKAIAIQKKKNIEQEKQEKRIQKEIEKDAREERKQNEAIEKAVRKLELAKQRVQKKEDERKSINARKRKREELDTMLQLVKKVKTSQQDKVHKNVVIIEEEGTEISAARTGRGRQIQLPQRFKK